MVAVAGVMIMASLVDLLMPCADRRAFTGQSISHGEARASRLERIGVSNEALLYCYREAISDVMRLDVSENSSTKRQMIIRRSPLPLLDEE